MPPAPRSPEPEDALVVGDHDEPHVVVRAVAQDLRDPVAIVRRDPGAARAAQDVAELLAGAPDGRRVDDRQQLLEVLGQDPVEERGVAVLERRQADVLLERSSLRRRRSSSRATCSSMVMTRSGSRPRRPNASRSSAVKAKSLVNSRLREQGGAAERDLGRPAGGDGVVRRRQRAHRCLEDTQRHVVWGLRRRRDRRAALV